MARNTTAIPEATAAVFVMMLMNRAARGQPNRETFSNPTFRGIVRLDAYEVCRKIRLQPGARRLGGCTVARSIAGKSAGVRCRFCQIEQVRCAALLELPSQRGGHLYAQRRPVLRHE